MCEFMSFFVHRRADKLPKDKRYLFGGLRSHSETAKLCGHAYGKGADDWAEAEWTSEDDGASLDVRDERSAVLRSVVIGDFKTRAGALRYGVGHLPASLTTLYLNYATVSGDLKLPASLTTLDLNYAKVSGDLVIPPQTRVLR